MTTITPSIIFNVQYVATQFHKGNKPSKMKTINTNDAIDYYDRDEACDKTFYSNQNDEEDDYIINTQNAFDYYNYRVGSTGGFNKNGNMEMNYAKNIINKYQPSIMYRMVFSFDEQFAIDNNIKLKSNMQKLITKTMGKNIREFGLNPDNVEWGAYYHTNTAHPHIHCWMFEKEPSKINHLLSKKGIQKVKSNIVSNLSTNIERYIERDDMKKEILKMLNNLGLSKHSSKLLIKSQNNGKKFFNKDKNISESLKSLERKIPKYGSMKYNSKNIRPFHDDIEKIIKSLKDKDDIKPLVVQYEAQLEDECIKQKQLYGGSFDDEKKMRFIDNKHTELDNRIANMILGNIKNYRLDKEQYEEEDEFEFIDENTGEVKRSRKRSTFKSRGSMGTRAENMNYATADELSKAIYNNAQALQSLQHDLDNMKNIANKENQKQLFD